MVSFWGAEIFSEAVLAPQGPLSTLNLRRLNGQLIKN